MPELQVIKHSNSELNDPYCNDIQGFNCIKYFNNNIKSYIFAFLAKVRHPRIYKQKDWLLNNYFCVLIKFSRALHENERFLIK